MISSETFLSCISYYMLVRFFYTHAGTGGRDDGNEPKPVDVYFNMGLWVSTILFAVLAICWGLVAVVFSAINASIRPIETITGPMGLYLWNGLAGKMNLFSLFFQICWYKYLDGN